MQTVILATGNRNKLAEMAALLAGLDLNIVSQADYQVPTAAETGLSFVENAIIKARNAAQHTGLAAIADDSGIEVDALQGAPGIYSARYAAPHVSDQNNLQKLLAALQDVPEARRTARFQCVIAYLRHANDPTPVLCQGTWQGRIALAAKGDNGFGYDPIFYLPELDKTAAELSPQEKSQLSHRGQALQQLKQALLR